MKKRSILKRKKRNGYVIILMSSHNNPVAPVAIDAFNGYITSTMTYLTPAVVTRLKIAAANMTALTALQTDPVTGWNNLYLLHGNTVTRTGTVNHNLADNETAITHLLSSIYKDIPRSAMITADYDALNIAPPVTHHADRAKITNVPFVTIYSRSASVDFIVRTDKSSGRAHMDPLADVIEICYVLMKDGVAPPTDPSQCPNTFTSTVALFNHKFTPSDGGMHFYAYLRFVNQSDAAKNGDWCKLVTCIIGL